MDMIRHIINGPNGHECEQTPGDSGGQGSLVSCSPWGGKELDTTYWLNNNREKNMLGKRRTYVCICLREESLRRFSSVQFSRSVTSESLWPHELQHARPPCPSPTPRVDRCYVCGIRRGRERIRRGMCESASFAWYTATELASCPLLGSSENT